MIDPKVSGLLLLCINERLFLSFSLSLSVA
uniref:Uncharacterized protein n=1 Tax=Anguilla anguilla TaxID=7936 RepID=A0A0E9VUX5_ANGAN